MKQMKRLLAGVLALSLALPMGVSAMAATANDGVEVSSGKLYLLRDGKRSKTYTLENTNIRLMLSTKGNMLVGYMKKDAENNTNTTLGSGNTTTVKGTMDELVIASSLPADKTITVSATIRDLTVDSAAKVILGKDAQITNLKVTNKAAKVTGQAGCSAKSVSAVSGASVTGVGAGKVSSLTEQNAQSVISKSKVPTFVEMEEKDGTNYTKSISFDGKTLTIEGNKGVKVGSAIKDVKLTVYREDNSDTKVNGTWKWVNSSDSAKTVSGKYQYRFTPSSADLYPVITLTVDYTGSGTTRTLSKPDIEFEGRSHGDISEIEIRVGIPFGIDDDDRMYIYVNGKEYDKVYLSDSDAGDDETYSLGDIQKLEDCGVKNKSGEQIKIKIKVQRTRYDSDGEERSGGSSVSSKTIKYEID